MAENEVSISEIFAAYKQSYANKACAVPWITPLTKTPASRNITVEDWNSAMKNTQNVSSDSVAVYTILCSLESSLENGKFADGLKVVISEDDTRSLTEICKSLSGYVKPSDIKFIQNGNTYTIAIGTIKALTFTLPTVPSFGEGLSVSSNTVSVDFGTVAKKSDIPSIPTPGSGLTLSSSNVLSVDYDAIEEGINIPDATTAGDGLVKTGNELSVNFTVVAKKSELPAVPGVGDGLTTDESGNYAVDYPTVSGKLGISNKLEKSDISVAQDSGNSLKYNVIVKGTTVGTITIPADKYVSTVTYDSANKQIVFTFSKGESVKVNVADLIDTYTAGTGLKLEGNKFSLDTDYISSNLPLEGSSPIYVDGSTIGLNYDSDSLYSDSNSLKVNWSYLSSLNSGNVFYGCNGFWLNYDGDSLTTEDCNGLRVNWGAMPIDYNIFDRDSSNTLKISSDNKLLDIGLYGTPSSSALYIDSSNSNSNLQGLYLTYHSNIIKMTDKYLHIGTVTDSPEYSLDLSCNTKPIVFTAPNVQGYIDKDYFDIYTGQYDASNSCDNYHFSVGKTGVYLGADSCNIEISVGTGGFTSRFGDSNNLENYIFNVNADGIYLQADHCNLEMCISDNCGIHLTKETANGSAHIELDNYISLKGNNYEFRVDSDGLYIDASEQGLIYTSNNNLYIDGIYTVSMLNGKTLFSDGYVIIGGEAGTGMFLGSGGEVPSSYLPEWLTSGMWLGGQSYGFGVNSSNFAGILTYDGAQIGVDGNGSNQIILRNKENNGVVTLSDGSISIQVSSSSSTVANIEATTSHILLQYGSGSNAIIELKSDGVYIGGQKYGA